MAEALVIDDIEVAELGPDGKTVAFNSTRSLHPSDVRTVVEALRFWLEHGTFPDA